VEEKNLSILYVHTYAGAVKVLKLDTVNSMEEKIFLWACKNFISFSLGLLCEVFDKKCYFYSVKTIRRLLLLVLTCTVQVLLCEVSFLNMILLVNAP
jgi:hypothetical protein